QARHVRVQPSSLSVLPSSHCSTPRQTKPSPHAARLQPFKQASSLALFPSSQASFGSRRELPQSSGAGSRLQVALQPSPSTRLPSSHSSSPSFALFPHRFVSSWHPALQ